jgi:hypothetical protein
MRRLTGRLHASSVCSLASVVVVVAGVPLVVVGLPLLAGVPRCVGGLGELRARPGPLVVVGAAGAVLLFPSAPLPNTQEAS